MSCAALAPTRRLRLGALAPLALTLGACQTTGSAQAPGMDLAVARQAVAAADSGFAAAARAHDLEGSVGSLTADAVMFPPDQPPIVGRAAIREYMRGSFALPHFSVSWTTDTIVVAASGDMAYSYARSRYTFPARSGAAGAVDTAYGKGVSIWRRDTDGRWRTTADIWNGAPPVLPAIRPSGSSD
jgi:ketosteroid isomerase-like protein